jgi:hypothetical protein
MSTILIPAKQLRDKHSLEICDSHNFDISSALKGKGELSLIFIIKNKNKHNMLDLSKYNTSDIIAIYSVRYDKKNKVCELCELIHNKKHLKMVIELIHANLPKETIIWAGTMTDKNMKSANVYIHSDFNSPYFCDKSPLGNKYPFGIAFLLGDTLNPKCGELSRESIKNKLDYTLSQKNNKNCHLYAKITKEASSFLKGLIDNHSIKKEVTGSICVVDILQEKSGKIIFILGTSLTPIIQGNDETVDAVWSLYNFHTHPKSAYDRHKVKIGYPSSTDFVGFIQLDNHTLFHTVVTLEGLYIISFAEGWVNNIRDIDKDEILDIYDIDHSENITPQEWVTRINNTKYRGKQLYQVKFMKWGDTDHVFPVTYKKFEGNCYATDKGFDLTR